jgi:hypothetical protein
MAWYENPVIYRTVRSIMSDKASLPVAFLDWREAQLQDDRGRWKPRRAGHDHACRLQRLGAVKRS